MGQFVHRLRARAFSYCVECQHGKRRYMSTLNKTIWLLWLQGWDSAPWLIRQVAESSRMFIWNTAYFSKQKLISARIYTAEGFKRGLS